MERVVVVGSLLAVCSIFILISLNHVYALNSEGEALLAFKSRLNVSFTEELVSWHPDHETPCVRSWSHVTCNDANSVTRVDLGGAGLYGELHLDLTNLPNLDTLNLYANVLYGDLTNLILSPNLESLYLYTNALSGDLNNLKLWPNLKNIDLSDNLLEGTISAEFTKLSHLEILDLSSNNLKGTLPEWIGTQTNMTSIDLLDNSLSGSVPKSWDSAIQNTRLVNLTHNYDTSSNKYTIRLTGSCTTQPCGHNLLSY